MYNIVNGQVGAETEVNVQGAVEFGRDMITCFASSLPGGFHHQMQNTVKTMQVLNHDVKIKREQLYDLKAVLVSPSLIDEYGCFKKRNKAVLVNRLGVTVSNPPSPDKLFVDASQMLYHIV